MIRLNTGWYGEHIVHKQGGIFLPLSTSSDLITFTYRFIVTDYSGNGGDAIGLVENLDAPVQYGEVDAIGIFTRIYHFSERGGPFWVTLISGTQDGQWYDSWNENKQINYKGVNSWHLVTLNINNGNWI